LIINPQEVIFVTWSLLNLRTTAHKHGAHSALEENLTILTRPALIVVCTLALLALDPAVYIVFYLILALWALIGVRQSIQALFLSVLFKFLNPVIFVTPEHAAVLGWLVLFAAAGRIFLAAAHSRRIPRSFFWLLLFSIVIALLSYFSSYDVKISLFKVTAFTIGASAALLGFRITASEYEYWKSWFYTVFVTTLFLSIPTLLVPDVAYARNGTGFQGILSHPQAYGLYLAPITAWLTGTFLLSKHRNDFLLWTIILLAWGELFLTRSRTAVLAVLLGLTITAIASLLTRPDWWAKVRKAILRPASIFFLFALITATAMKASTVQEAMLDFIYKGTQEEFTMNEAFYGSRGNLIEKSWINFQDNPLTGIGFGVPSYYELLVVEYDPVLGIPVGAPTEKGFIVTALLEEVGLLGFMVFLCLFFALARAVLRKTAMSSAWLFFTCVFINFGEMALFSMGGMGLYLWLLIGFSLTSNPRVMHGA
jgi:hypothetical protein